MPPQNARQKYIRQCQTFLQSAGEDHHKLGIMAWAINDFDRLKGLLGIESIMEIHRQNIDLIDDEVGDDVHVIPQPPHELVVIVNEVENTATLIARANDLLSRLDDSRSLPYQSIQFRYDVGLAVYPDHGESADDLLQNAEYARYRASEDPVNSYGLYDPDQAQRSRSDVRLSSEISRALVQNEFELYFQPIVSIDTGRIHGAEALIRWNHPDQGRLSPARFIPMTEATGQILFIDQWVLNRAVRWASEWFHQWDRTFHLHFNVSAIQFQDQEFVNKVQTALNDHEVPPHLLTLELTETAVMKDPSMAETVLDDLKSLGVSLAVDDFGTGQSTFKYLNRFPLERLKIDRQFMQFDDDQPKNKQLVEIMMETGHRLKKSLIVEGIETQSQLEYAKENQCELAQGFYFSKPLPRARIDDLLQDGTRYPL